MKKILATILTILATLTAFSACDFGNLPDSGSVSESSSSQSSSESSNDISLSAKTAITLKVGETENMAVVAPEDAEVVYTSSDPLVAVVDENGLITAVGEGTADITARVGGESVKCVVTVPHVYVYEMALNSEEIELFVGGESTVGYAVTRDGNAYELGDNENVTFSVENEAVATVEGNVVKAVSLGETTLTATANLAEGTVVATLKVKVIASATVQFSVEGELSEKIEYGIGRKVEKPEDPTLEGFVFVGWVVDGVPFDFDAGVQEDTIVKAEFAKLEKLVASDESAVVFDNSWIQSLTTYTYTTDVKAPNEAGSTAVSSDFDGAWCELKLGDFAFSEYPVIYFSFGVDKATRICFNTGAGDYENWVDVTAGNLYTVIIRANENEGHVNIWLNGELWYYNLERANLNSAAFTHTTKAGENKITMYMGAIWGINNSNTLLMADVETEGSIAYDFAQLSEYELNVPEQLLAAGEKYAALAEKLEKLTPYEYSVVMTEENRQILERVELASKIETGVILDYNLSRGGAKAINTTTGAATPIYDDTTGDSATGSMLKNGNLYFYLQTDPHGQEYYQITLPVVNYAKYIAVSFDFVTNNGLGAGFALDNSVAEEAVKGNLLFVYVEQQLKVTLTTASGKSVTKVINDADVINGNKGADFFVMGQAYTDITITPASAYFIPSDEITVVKEIMNFTTSGNGAKAVNVTTGAVTPYGDENGVCVDGGGRLKFCLQTDPHSEANYAISLPTIDFTEYATVWFSFETNNAPGLGLSEDNVIQAEGLDGMIKFESTATGLVVTVIANGQTIATTVTDESVIKGEKAFSFFVAGQEYTEFYAYAIYGQEYTA